MSSAANTAFDDYQYQPLDHATQQTRLVTLLDPLENDDAIHLDINIFDISEAPPYTALSYVWGPPSNNAVYIAAGRIGIRKNLFEFLTQFRKCRDKTPSDQYLWIDQLCIDQSDTVERNHQVQMMSDIYSKATSVITWLGDGSENLSLGREFLRKRGFGELKDMYDAACAWKYRAEVNALGFIFNHRYFVRLWIVQEFILARRIRILVKDIWVVDDTCGWEHRAETLHNELRKYLAKRVFNLIGHSSLRRTGEFTHLDICTVLDNYGGNGCGEERDKIYGLLGLMRPDQRVTVDYEKSYDQLYMDATLLVLQSQCLDTPKDASAPDQVSRVMYQIASNLWICWAMQRGFIALASDMTHVDRLQRFRGHACPITAVGLENRPPRYPNRAYWRKTLIKRKPCELDRGWFDFQGTRHVVYFTEEANEMADETKRLLEEDWEKYVPLDHADKKS